MAARVFGSMAVLAASAALAGCNASGGIGDAQGVPLAELDTGGSPPERLVLASPDQVVVREGDRLAIDLAGPDEATGRMRFELKDGTLAVMRERGDWKDDGKATVTVTMPPLREVTMAGSGTIDAASLAGDEAEATIAGSGTMRIARIAAERLDINILGSGSLQGAGTTDRLDLNIAGSGSARTPGLRVGSAEIGIAGSGGGEFESNGTVEASIVGSGTVRVHGDAQCKASKVGSGRLICGGTGAAAAGE